MNNQENQKRTDTEHKHEQTKRKLKIIGISVLSIGLIFTIIGFISFFTSFGSGDMPSLFWCSFIGLPMFAVGLSITSLAFKREISRYVKNESVPIINEAGREVSPAVRDIASAVKEGISDNNESRCPLCGEFNEKGSKFCKNCGKSFIKVCPFCGQEIDFDSSFCNYCGKKL